METHSRVSGVIEASEMSWPLTIELRHAAHVNKHKMSILLNTQRPGLKRLINIKYYDISGALITHDTHLNSPG